MEKSTTKTTKKATAKKATAKKVPKKFEKRDIKKSFWFKLTEKEKKHHADEMVRVMTEKGKKELQFSDVKKKWQGQIKELETEVESHRQTYNAGKEWREVACIEVKDFQKLEIRYLIGKKVQESRAMDEREKQMTLQVKGKPITEKNKSEGKADVVDIKSGEIKDVIKEETNKKTKTSPLNNSKTVETSSSAYAELHGTEPTQ